MDFKEFTLPTERDLPPGHLQLRRRALVDKITAEIDSNAARRLKRPRSWRPVAIFAPVAVAIAATVLATPAFGIRDDILRAVGIKHAPAQYNPSPANVAVPALEREWQDALASGAAADPQMQ